MSRKRTGSSGGELGAEIDILLRLSRDAYELEQDATPYTRHSIPNAEENVASLWIAIALAGQGILGQYSYEVPGEDHVANSNAFIFSALHAVGIDVRQFARTPRD